MFSCSDGKTGHAKKDAWNAGQKGASHLMIYPVALRKQLMEEAKRQPYVVFEA